MMSKERELLQRIVDFADTYLEIDMEFIPTIKELLAQPEQEQEPLSFEDLNIMWCGNPIDFARRIESIHGIGVDDE
jgi:hypothetical protein